jgi:hypothetical protein
MAAGQQNPKPSRGRGGAGILIRAKGEERERLKKRARAANLTLNDYLIECGLTTATPPDPRERELRERAVFEIRKVSFNLDRIAKRLNRGGSGAEQVQAAIRETAAAVEIVATAFTKEGR